MGTAGMLAGNHGSRLQDKVRAMRVFGVVLVLWLASVPASASDTGQALRVAVLKFGTVSWVIDVITHHGLDRKHGLRLSVTPLASTLATKVALQAGSTDVIVSDWLWVSRQRRTGADFTLAPYSTALGAVMVQEASEIEGLADLKGRTVGVAGGPLDKSWLLLTAFARRSAGIDLISETRQVFGAPPLLAEKARQGELDAVLNYWHFCARLEAHGFRRLVDVHAAMAGLGAQGRLPMIGYVFSEAWARKNPELIAGFLKASAEANALLAGSEAEWQRLRPLMRAGDDGTWRALRDRFREGIPKPGTTADGADAALLFGVLAKLGGAKLVGPGESLAAGTFWHGAGPMSSP